MRRLLGYLAAGERNQSGAEGRACYFYNGESTLKIKLHLICQTEVFCLMTSLPCRTSLTLVFMSDIRLRWTSSYALSNHVAFSGIQPVLPVRNDVGNPSISV